MKKTKITIALGFAVTLILSGCFGGRMSSSGRGGEVVGVSGRSFNEPTPYGMTLIKRGYLKMGLEKDDSLWGRQTPTKEISVDGFWMDETEVTNSEYKQFVFWVRDSILRTRLADPAYGGDETYMITEDKNGDPVTPHLNWKKTLPLDGQFWRRPSLPTVPVRQPERQENPSAARRHWAVRPCPISFVTATRTTPS